MPDVSTGASVRDAYQAALYEAERAKLRLEGVKSAAAIGAYDPDEYVTELAKAQKAYDDAQTKSEDLRTQYMYGKPLESIAPKRTWYNGPVGVPTIV